MANQLTSTNISARTYVTPLSRYVNSRIFYYTMNNIITFETYKRRPITISSQDKFMLVTAGTQYRPDLVSIAAYGFPDYWWKIMEVNGIFDVFAFEIGVNIRIPALTI